MIKLSYHSLCAVAYTGVEYPVNRASKRAFLPAHFEATLTRARNRRVEIILTLQKPGE